MFQGKGEGSRKKEGDEEEEEGERTLKVSRLGEIHGEGKGNPFTATGRQIRHPGLVFSFFFLPSFLLSLLGDG